MNIERPKVGIGAVVVNQNKVLLGKRKGAHGAGDWAFPGGNLEFGETPEECALRELFEETSLKATNIISGPWTNDIFEQNEHYITLFIFVREFTGTAQVVEPHKCEGWNWFEWEDLPYPLFKPVVTLVNNVGIQFLKDQFSIEGCYTS